MDFLRWLNVALMTTEVVNQICHREPFQCNLLGTCNPPGLLPGRAQDSCSYDPFRNDVFGDTGAPDTCDLAEKSVCLPGGRAQGLRQAAGVAGQAIFEAHRSTSRPFGPPGRKGGSVSSFFFPFCLPGVVAHADGQIYRDAEFALEGSFRGELGALCPMGHGGDEYRDYFARIRLTLAGDVVGTKLADGETLPLSDESTTLTTEPVVPAAPSVSDSAPEAPAAPPAAPQAESAE